MKRWALLSGLFGVALGVTTMGCGDDGSTSGGGTGGTTASGGTGGTGGTTVTGGTGGTTASGGTGGTGGSPPLMCDPLADDCSQCAHTSCEQLYCACYASTDCADLVTCLSPCDPLDEACQQPCLSAHKDSISDAFLLADCAAGGCSASCAASFDIPPCPQCLFEKCPTEMNECFADTDCHAIITCVGDCPAGDFACAIGCTNGKPQASIDKAFPVQGCATGAQKCGPACGQ